MSTEAPPQWRPSPIALGAVLLGEDLAAIAELQHADRDGHLTGLLERAFYGADVEALFHPQPGSPASLIDALLDAKMTQVGFPDAASAYARLTQLLDGAWKVAAERLWSDYRQGFETLLALRVNVEGTEFGTPKVPHAIADYVPWEASVVQQGARLPEPLQGPWSDCWLVASMSAIAWSEPDWFDRFLESLPVEPRPVPTVRWRFRRQVRERLVESSFPRAPNKARIHTVSASRGETWPALIEKAFALRGLRADGEPNSGRNPTLAQYQSLALDWPSKALSLLGPTDYKEVSLHLFDHLRACCPPNEVPKVPVVACTLEDLKAQEDGYRIVPNHAYAVLGIDEAHDGSYVVLREPYGHLHKSQRVDFESAEFRSRPPVRVGVHGVIALPKDAFRDRFRAVSVPKATQRLES